MRFTLVHSLRGLAATAVVFYHAWAGHHVSFSVFQFGNNGVAVFFALSGFVIAHSISGDRITGGYVGRFALRRSIRLDPAYWASIALFLAFAAASALAKDEAFPLPSAGQLASNLTYSQLFLGYPSINDVYWTLCYEVQFYLALIVCVMAAQRLGTWAYLIPFAIAVLFGTRLIHQPFAGLFVELWHGFFLGALAYWGISKRTALAAFVVLSAALIVSQPNVFTWVCMVTAAALLVAGKTDYLHRGLAWKPLMFLGTISYSLYLTHNPVSGAAFFVLAKAHAPGLPALILAVATCIAAAWAFWFVVERPTLAFAKKVPLRRPSERGESAGLKVNATESALTAIKTGCTEYSRISQCVRAGRKPTMH